VDSTADADPYDIFVSHASEDRRRTELVTKALARQQWRFWWDKQIVPGRSYDSAIERAIRSSKVVLVLWSRAAVDRSWVRAEADLAKELGVFVPARLDPVSLPLAFRLDQTVDLCDWVPTSRHEGFDTLLSTIAERIGKPVVDRQPEFTAPQHAELGARYAGRGQLELALASYLSAVAVDPDYEPAIEALERLSQPGPGALNPGGRRELADLKFGVLKWFNARKGFGFVTPADGGPDLFVHIAAVEGTEEGVVDGENCEREENERIEN